MPFMPFKISNQQKVKVLGLFIHTAYIDCFLLPDVCWKWFRLEWKWKRSVSTIRAGKWNWHLNFPADTSYFDFDPNPINQSIFPVDTSVQPDLNPNSINQGPADVSNDNSIGTPSNNLPLRESTNTSENSPKRKRARTQIEKSERHAKNYSVLLPCK